MAITEGPMRRKASMRMEKDEGDATDDGERDDAGNAMGMRRCRKSQQLLKRQKVGG